MKHWIFTLLLSILSLASFAQSDTDKGFQQQMEEMEQELQKALNSLDQAFEDSRLEMEKLNLGKTGQPGQLRIYTDTLDFKQMFDMMEQSWQELPFLGQQEIPEEYREGFRENSLMLPDLLLRSSELLENSDVESLFENLLKQLEENGDLLRPMPTPDGKKIRKT